MLIPFAFTALVGYYYYRRSGFARGLVLFPFSFFTGFNVMCVVDTEPYAYLETQGRRMEGSLVLWIH